MVGFVHGHSVLVGDRGPFLLTIYASSGRGGSLLVGPPWMGPDGAATQLLFSLVTVSLGSGSRLVLVQKAFLILSRGSPLVGRRVPTISSRLNK